MTESEVFSKYSSEIFIVLQPDGVIVDANPACLGMTGRTLESLRGQRFQDLISDSDRADVETLVSGIAKSSEPMEHQARIIDGEGGKRPMQWMFVRHEATSRICVIGRDLTHELAAKREAALGTVLLHAQNVAWAIERDGTFYVHTGGATKNLGMTPGQLLGLNYFQLYAEVPPVRDAAIKALAGEVVEDNDSLVFDRFFNAITVPVRAANGEVIGVAGLTTDITALKRTQKELEEKLALIEDQQRTIQDLSTPIIEVWKGVVAVPVLGTLNGERANKLMERLLEYIVTKQIRCAVLDMTGATAVDEGTADALGRIVQAISLLGAEALLVGLSPSVAQTIVALGISLSAVKTLRNLEEGLRYCMQRK